MSMPAEKKRGDRLGRGGNPGERNPRNLPNIPKLTQINAGGYRPVNRSGPEKNTGRWPVAEDFLPAMESGGKRGGRLEGPRWADGEGP